MSSLNVLVIAGENSISLPLLLKSKYLNKLYSTFESEYSTQIKYNTFRELAQKCKALRIDLVLVEDEKLILQGIADVLRTNFVNCIAITSDWTKLLLSNEFARNMMIKYGIDVPEIQSYPQDFPLIIRADGKKQIASSLEEVIKLRQQDFNCSPEIAKTIVLEKYIQGEKYTLTSLFDGKNLITFPPEGLDKNLIKEFNDKLSNLFLNEGANFIGYINSEVVYCNEKLYHVGFNLKFPRWNSDIIYILTLAIYQKLNEFDLMNS